MPKDEKRQTPVKPEPIRISAGMQKIADDDFAWEAYRIKTQGTKVLEFERIATPNIRSITEEKMKVWIANNILR